ncbi:MAG: hypothetical protein LBR16_07485 [Treponema sp.]|jgi:hypothetical protein|nr:hypothetical protein [Treponema sp.]
MKTKKLQKAVTILCAALAVLELLVSYKTIAMTLLSTVELTGIALFAFMITGLVTLFAVTRMGGVSFGRRLFACIAALLSAVSGLWYLLLLRSDAKFFQNIYFSLNRATGVYEPLALGQRAAASVPLAFVALGAALYGLSALVILGMAIADSVRGEKG